MGQILGLGPERGVGFDNDDGICLAVARSQPEMVQERHFFSRFYDSSYFAGSYDLFWGEYDFRRNTFVRSRLVCGKDFFSENLKCDILK